MVDRKRAARDEKRKVKKAKTREPSPVLDVESEQSASPVLESDTEAKDDNASDLDLKDDADPESELSNENGGEDANTNGHTNGSKRLDSDDDDDEKKGSGNESDESGNEEEEEDEDNAEGNDADEDDDEDEKKRISTFLFDGTDYSYKERPSVLEEREGKIEFRVVNNDNTRENMIVLTGLKNIFQKQLPKMPRVYISRLVYDRSHLSMAVVRKPLTVVGGITYRPFDNRGFAEIVFCAISSTEQVRGYGAHLMNHLKDYVRATSPVKYFLTYADNYAIGYFKKQGFTKEITLDRLVWTGYIKDYEGGTLMQCSMLPSRLRYLDLGKILLLQKAAIEKKIKSRSQSHVVRPGIRLFKNAKPDFKILPNDIPGLVDSGWLEEMDKLAQKPKRGPHYNFMVTLMSELTNNPLAWPFAVPVNKDEVGDYYDVIKEPMDLSTMESKLENDKYESFDKFLYDCKLIFNNCRAYNAETTTYYKNATKLEKFLNKKIKESADYSHYLE
ncbi:hypothetical protein PUMCH_002246 [Australozyma saopauloensis]|uniref:Histone acetyltransferase GCN5 n=1 Tax=Australozyma saopauloensis TaxID=291208 RepID=A0AAX4H8U6_9ASCO|nr:hypothetical protein PUMCH_002246 [[Candida] saopauloensis]